MSFNIIDLVKSQLGGNTIAQLSSLIGESPDKTETAVGASVPALLAGLTSAPQSRREPASAYLGSFKSPFCVLCTTGSQNLVFLRGSLIMALVRRQGG